MREKIDRALWIVFLMQLLSLSIGLILCPFWGLARELFSADAIATTMISYAGTILLTFTLGFLNSTRGR